MKSFLFLVLFPSRRDLKRLELSIAMVRVPGVSRSAVNAITTGKVKSNTRSLTQNYKFSMHNNPDAGDKNLPSLSVCTCFPKPFGTQGTRSNGFA